MARGKATDFHVGHLGQDLVGLIPMSAAAYVTYFHDFALSFLDLLLWGFFREI
jgi:hypothetical protein